MKQEVQNNTQLDWKAQTFVPKIAVVGLGYVGLPLLAEFGRTAWGPVSGFDVSESRIESLTKGIDANNDLPEGALADVSASYSNDPKVISESNFIIVAVPTPIGKANQPDLTIMESASRTVAAHIKSGSIVVYESTVYPGVTEEVCVPIIEEISGLRCGVDFKVGYSPERVNPGDHEHTIEKVVKIVSGMDEETLEIVANVYSAVCKGGVHKAPTIRTAEAAKVIENVQRDLNIALMNELSVIFHLMDIDTHDVIEAAGTKWNFHKYTPGLVGGHCIGVDPYYLTHKAQEFGYNPDVILAGRRINDSMGARVASHVLEALVNAGKVVQDARVLVMGLTFKPDIRDMRNSKIKDTISKLKTYGVDLIGYDPNLTNEEVASFGVEVVNDLSDAVELDGIIVATAHKQFKDITVSDLLSHCNSNGDGRRVLIDVKGIYRNDVQSIEELIYTAL